MVGTVVFTWALRTLQKQKLARAPETFWSSHLLKAKPLCKHKLFLKKRKDVALKLIVDAEGHVFCLHEADGSPQPCAGK